MAHLTAPPRGVVVMALGPTRASARARVHAFLLFALGAVSACNDPGDNASSIVRPLGRPGFSRTDSASLGLLRSRIGAVGTMAGTSDPGTSIVSITPSYSQGYAQPQTIVGMVAGPVQQISVTGGARGAGTAIKCTGTYGTIIGYDVDGVELGRQNLDLIEPADCSPPSNPDDLTYGAAGTLRVSNGIIATFEITPMSPLEFDVLGTPGGHASATYAIDVGFLAAPRILVNCTPVTITRASSTPVSCTASATGGSLAITGWRFTATDQNTGSVNVSQSSTTWSGKAVASGGVTVQGTVGGVAAESDTGRISVIARTAWSWSAATSSGMADPGTFECIAVPHYATDTFGWVRADSTCRNQLLMLWPDYKGLSSSRGYAIFQVLDAGPNTGLWYATSDKTGMHIRAQILSDLRPNATNKYPVNGKDTVNTRCKAARVNSSAIVTVVNNTCMTDPSPLNFAAMYTFVVKHEQCHMTQFMNAFPSIPDPRTHLETIVRGDTTAFHDAATNGAGSYDAANIAILQSNTIDQPNPQTYKFWSRNPENMTNPANVAWILRPYSPNAILLAGC
jgi:hypothetical protein